MAANISSPKHRIPEHSGFTIIELLAVLVIIGTLVGLLIPAVQQARVTAGGVSQSSFAPPGTRF